MPRDDLTIDDGEARIEGEDRTSLVVELPGSRQEFELPRIATMAVVDTDLWVAHLDGIKVYRRAIPPAVGVTEVASLRLPGPVTHVFPRRAGQGASFVSALGGMGTTEWKPVGELPSTTGGK
jgi:hypothetical protein